MARTSEFKIEGFPNFDGTLADLKQFQRSPLPEYKVCVASGNNLIVRDALIQFWCQKHPEFADKMTSIVDAHDKEFNHSKLKRGVENTTNGEQSDERPSKRLCLNQAKTMNELESEHSDSMFLNYFSLISQLSLQPFFYVSSFPNFFRLVHSLAIGFSSLLHTLGPLLRLALNCGNFSLSLVEDNGAVWIGATAQTNVEALTELFGFGSGGFVRQSEATDSMSDSAGRWVNFSFSDTNNYVVLEKGRSVQSHLENQPFWNKV